MNLAIADCVLLRFLSNHLIFVAVKVRMPSAMNTIRELYSYFDFLLGLPNIPIDQIPLDDRVCAFCHEGYEITAWRRNQTMNCPVRLHCGHIFGVQCLARWILSPNFNNTCPYCQTKLMRISGKRSPDSLEMFGQLLAVIEDLTSYKYPIGGTASKAMLRSLEPKRWDPSRLSSGEADRTMMIYEKVINSNKLYRDNIPAPTPPATAHHFMFGELAHRNLVADLLASVIVFICRALFDAIDVERLRSDLLYRLSLSGLACTILTICLFILIRRIEKVCLGYLKEWVDLQRRF